MNSKSSAEIYTGFFLAIIFWLPGVWVNGWVISTIWEWYIIPIFNFNPIGVAGGIGLAIFSGLLTYRYRKLNLDDENIPTLVIGLFLRPLVVLGAAWLYLFIWPV